MAVSLSSLSLPWLDPSRKCQPGRYITPEAKQRRIQAERRKRELRSDIATPFFMPDVDAAYGGAWQSIVDGKEISSRSNWREHNKRNQVVDVGDKFWSPDGDDIKRTQEKMGWDPTLIGKDFVWGGDDASTD